MKSSWLWNVNKTEEEAKRILADPSDERFVHYAALLLSRRRGLPKEIFSEYLSKENFCRYWIDIKRKMRKDNWNDQRVPFWNEVYTRLVRKFGEEGVVFPRPKKQVSKDPALEKIAADIRSRRKGARLTQAELAKKMGVKQQFIAKIESGTQNLSSATLQKIDKALGTSVYEYKAGRAAGASGRVAETGFPGGGSSELDRHVPSTIRHPDVLTWFTSDLGLRTQSQ